MDKDTPKQDGGQCAAVLESLKGSMTAGTFNKHFLGAMAHFDGKTCEITLPASANLPMVENKLIDPVSRAIKSVTGQVYRLRFVKAEPKPVEVDEVEPDAEFSGVYHDDRNQRIQPDKVEVFTQYYRRKWRPLLGPLHSELVRELRQRCHTATGRNTVKTTYKSLAAALGVSEPTIKRALKRNANGEFVKVELNQFIARMETVRYSKGDKSIRNEGTHFAIYLDEPLTPDDQNEIS